MDMLKQTGTPAWESEVLMSVNTAVSSWDVVRACCFVGFDPPLPHIHSRHAGGQMAWWKHEHGALGGTG